jgi:hypothetical protein
MKATSAAGGDACGRRLRGSAGDLAQFIVAPDGRAPGQALPFLLQVKLLELQ